MVCMRMHASCICTHTRSMHMHTRPHTQAYVCAHILMPRNSNLTFSSTSFSLFYLYNMPLPYFISCLCCWVNFQLLKKNGWRKWLKSGFSCFFVNTQCVTRWKVKHRVCFTFQLDTHIMCYKVTYFDVSL